MGGVRLSKRELQCLSTTDDFAGRKKSKETMRYDVTPQMLESRCRFRPHCTDAFDNVEQDDEDDLLECFEGDHGHRLLPATPLKQCIQENLCCTKCAKYHVVSTLNDFCDFLTSTSISRTHLSSFYREKLKEFLEQKENWQPYTPVTVTYNQLFAATEMTIKCKGGMEGKKSDICHQATVMPKLVGSEMNAYT